MSDLVPIFVVGFCILGTYKVFELFAKRKERVLFIEKLASLYELNEEDKEKRLKIQFPFTSETNSGYLPLRVALLLAGIGAGCLLAFIIQITIFYNGSGIHSSYRDWSYEFQGLILLVNFASISLLGGIGLLIAYLIEQRKKK